jgi:hypothetical protein
VRRGRRTRRAKPAVTRFMPTSSATALSASRCERHSVDAFRLAQIHDLSVLAVRADDDCGERGGRLRVHREDRYRRLGVIGPRTIRGSELKDEEVEALLFPGVDRPQVGDAAADRTVVRRPLQWRQQL